MTLHWENEVWTQSLGQFEEGQKAVQYGATASGPSIYGAEIDWVKIGLEYASGRTPDWQSFYKHWSSAA